MNQPHHQTNKINNQKYIQTLCPTNVANVYWRVMTKQTKWKKLNEKTNSNLNIFHPTSKNNTEKLT